MLASESSSSLAEVKNVAECSYEEKLTTLSDMELSHEQSDNFVELLFLQIQFEAEKKENNRLGNPTKTLTNFQDSITKVETKIRTVKKEIDRRDSITASRISILHRATGEIQSNCSFRRIPNARQKA
jgi:hypothetical protein